MTRSATNGKIHHYTLRRLEEIFDLSRTLSRYFPHPEQVMTGIYELLINAVEHGNLGVGAQAKNRLLSAGGWEAEVKRRLSLPQYAGREVKITVHEEEAECRLVIADEGRGFDWKKYLEEEIDPRARRGRGILIALKAGFDRMEFNASGNVVTCAAAVLPPGKKCKERDNTSMG